MQKYGTIEKCIGETPLQALERFRKIEKMAADVSLAYAGRLDPMASGKLLILIGDECKRQERYHTLDKEYLFEVLFGISTDTGDVLGTIKSSKSIEIKSETLASVPSRLIGTVELPYPHFSSKTVKGKPLHVWALEKRLDEIAIPIKESQIYTLSLLALERWTGKEIHKSATKKIASLPKVAEKTKELGRDFRRVEVLESWERFSKHCSDQFFTVAQFSCIASSGTYMRTLAEKIAEEVGTEGLAYSIHREHIGKYLKFPLIGGLWIKRF